MKVAIILEELNLPYTITNLDARSLKQEPYTTINPNGRVPAIQDPNTGITLWESGAIIQYLVETYDKDHKITYTSTPEKHLLTQWLMFQVSGQGPYFGQAAWFTFFHPEKLPSAQERYLKEIERVIGVLDGWLQKKTSNTTTTDTTTNDTPVLVGDKVTYADLAFVPYGSFVNKFPALNRDGKLFEGGKYPAYTKWLDSLLARPAVVKATAKFTAPSPKIE